MARLERNSHGRFRCAAPGRMLHAPGESLPRHCHREPFAAIVLAGGYDEAGDTGRHCVRAGDVIFHKAFESHLDQFNGPGAEVLVIPLPQEWHGGILGRIEDADMIVRASETDPIEALELLLSTVEARSGQALDWPDALAEALRSDPSISLDSWAETAGLHPGSLSRAFARVYGTTPAAYRAVQRTHQAIDALLSTNASLSRLAFECGFADQAHMTRAVTAIAGAPPAMVRRQSTPSANATDVRSPGD